MTVCRQKVRGNQKKIKIKGGRSLQSRQCSRKTGRNFQKQNERDEHSWEVREMTGKTKVVENNKKGHKQEEETHREKQGRLSRRQVVVVWGAGRLNSHFLLPSACRGPISESICPWGPMSRSTEELSQHVLVYTGNQRHHQSQVFHLTLAGAAFR